MNTQTNGACPSLAQQATTRAVTLLAMLALLVGFGIPESAAKPKQPAVVNVVPTVNSITVQDGQLVASGMVTAEVKGRVITAPFSGVPVELSLAANQTNQTNAVSCPILDLALGPITLDLLGLVIETSPICLQITAYDGGGLLGDLLCSVANLLNGGLTLDQILGGQGLVDPTGLVTLPGLTPAQLADLLGGLQNLLNGALENLLDAVLTLITEARGRTCSILHLELGPLDLNLLGLEVILDDCEGGPVIVDITAVRGKLLGNLLCGLLGGGGINLGATLQDILDSILGQLGPRQPAVINVVPTISSITVQDGQLVASGIVTADIRGRTATAPFSNVPVGLSLAANQTNQTNAVGCPILDLSLGPITVDLLGLVIETSPICLKITAYEGGGLLGDLLCSVANLLNGGLTLDQILGGQGLVDPMGVVTLPGLTPAQLADLLGGLQNLLNGALANLLDAVLTAITQATGRTCAILHLELGPLDLNLLGLEVILDDCEGGPVVVDITAVRGNLLGNLLCGLLQPRELGLTLQDLLDAILGRLGNQM